jgi:TRAP-type mannitol/chloroaromatic compound transport system substrate-binding protein
VGAGTQLRPFPRPVLDACFKATQEVFAETAAKNRTSSACTTTTSARSAT